MKSQIYFEYFLLFSLNLVTSELCHKSTNTTASAVEVGVHAVGGWNSDTLFLPPYHSSQMAFSFHTPVITFELFLYI